MHLNKCTILPILASQAQSFDKSLIHKELQQIIFKLLDAKFLLNTVVQRRVHCGHTALRIQLYLFQRLIESHTDQTNVGRYINQLRNTYFN